MGAGGAQVVYFEQWEMRKILSDAGERSVFMLIVSILVVR